MEFYNELLIRNQSGKNLRYNIDEAPVKIEPAPFETIKWNIQKATRDGKSIGKGLFAREPIEAGELPSAGVPC